MAISHESLEIFRHFFEVMPRFWRRRRGSLGPAQVVVSLMTMTVLGTKGYEKTISEMKVHLGKALGWLTDEDVPTASALCQARRKLGPPQCAALVSEVYAMCTSARACASLGYGGFRVVAEDGTKLVLPAYAALRRHFGCPSQGVGNELQGPQAALSVLWDVGANQPISWQLGPFRTSEQEQALALAPSVGPGDLFLADRNYPSRLFVTTLHLRKADMLMRIRGGCPGTMREVTAFLSTDAEEAVIDMETRDERGQHLTDLPTIPMRLMRTRLPDGSNAVFLTSLLDQNRHPARELITLYTARWRIETAFRELKIWHGLERFNARQVDGIAQEIAAMMIFQLLASELEARARMAHREAAIQDQPDEQPQSLQLPTVRFNRRILADCTVNLLMAAAAGGQSLVDVFRYSLFRLWRYRQSINPHPRSFPRQRKSSHRGWKPRGAEGKGKS